jgi:hypothetical protein
VIWKYERTSIIGIPSSGGRAWSTLAIDWSTFVFSDSCRAISKTLTTNAQPQTGILDKFACNSAKALICFARATRLASHRSRRAFAA